MKTFRKWLETYGGITPGAYETGKYHSLEYYDKKNPILRRVLPTELQTMSSSDLFREIDPTGHFDPEVVLGMGIAKTSKEKEEEETMAGIIKPNSDLDIRKLTNYDPKVFTFINMLRDKYYNDHPQNKQISALKPQEPQENVPTVIRKR